MSLIPFAPFADLNMIVRLTGLFPDDIFVVSSIDQRVDFTCSGATKKNSAFDTFAEEKF
jgi:hypothetical protein